MDCKHARLLLEVAHPLATELDVRDKEELAGHLADCPDCGASAESESRLDDHVAKAMQDVPVPPGLAQRVLGHLGVERREWYRKQFVRVAGVAAAVLLALWLSWALWLNRRPSPDWDIVSHDVSDFFATPQQVEESFAEIEVIMTAPPQFDYTRLQWHGLADFQGKQVPYLLFFYPGNKDTRPGVAKVYVLSSRQFDLERAPKTMALAGSRKNIKTMELPGRSDVLYVVEFTTETPLELFFLPGANPA